MEQLIKSFLSNADFGGTSIGISDEALQQCIEASQVYLQQGRFVFIQVQIDQANHLLNVFEMAGGRPILRDITNDDLILVCAEFQEIFKTNLEEGWELTLAIKVWDNEK